MIIHNFFSDTALSMYHFFENYVFSTKPFFYKNVIQTSKPTRFFKSMQFNLGNRVHQIGDYKESSKIEFPNAIISYVSDELAFGRDMASIGHHRIATCNEICVTHNRDTGVDIYVREDQSLIYFTFQVNCESQLQANEVVHQVKRYLPTGKYIQMMDFRSFIEIPDEFFSPERNDPVNHKIDNLFSRFDYTTGNPSYYFMMCYQPMIKLNSATVDFSDNSQRSYTVLFDLEYLIQLPVWAYCNLEDTLIDRINIGFIMDDNPKSIIINSNQINSSNEPQRINDVPYAIVDSIIIEKSDLVGSSSSSSSSSNIDDFSSSSSTSESEDFNPGLSLIEDTIIGTSINNKPSINNPSINNNSSINSSSNTSSTTNTKSNSNIEYKEQVIVPKPNVENFIIEVNKIIPDSSNVINDILSDNTQITDTSSVVLTKDQYIEREKDLVILLDDNLKPELNQPLIVRVLKPMDEEEVTVKKKQIKAFAEPYVIRDQKCWL